MTHIVIHQNSQTRDAYLLSLLEKLLNKKFGSLEDAYKNPDIHLLKEDGSIGIEQVKQLQKDMVYQPFQEIVQIAIVADAQNLTTEAQNAFLKTLEEQPAATEYILLVNNEKNLLDTIVSRGMKHYVKSDESNKIPDKVTKPKILDMDLVDRFNEIERVVKEEEIDMLIDSLLKYFRVQMDQALRENDDAIKYKLIIEKILLARTRLNANGNKRLVLENMILQITAD